MNKNELLEAVRQDIGGVYLVDTLAPTSDQEALDNAFVMACYLGKLSIMAILNFHGADPRYKNDLPLRITCRSPSHVTDVVKALLMLGSDPNSGDGGPLYSSAAEGYADTVKLLLDEGARHTFPGNPALPPACVKGHLPVVRHLVQAGADPELGIQALADDATVRSFREGLTLRSGGLKVANHQLETLYFLKGQTMPTLWDHLS